jgi:hypothetical protein
MRGFLAKIVMTPPTFPTHLGARLHSDGGGAGISCAASVKFLQGVAWVMLTLQL